MHNSTCAQITKYTFGGNSIIFTYTFMLFHIFVINTQKYLTNLKATKPQTTLTSMLFQMVRLLYI
jgi:hypothetical protein